MHELLLREPVLKTMRKLHITLLSQSLSCKVSTQNQRSRHKLVIALSAYQLSYALIQYNRVISLKIQSQTSENVFPNVLNQIN